MTEHNTGYPPAFKKADDFALRVIRIVSYVSAVCLAAIMFVAFFNVLGEKMFKRGIPMSTELIQYLHIPVVFLAAAYVTLDNGHTKIDLLSAHFPLRVRTLFSIVGSLLGTFICGFISWRGFIQMGKFIERHRMSSTSGLGFPLWPLALLFSVGFALFAFSFVWSIARGFARKEEM